MTAEGQPATPLCLAPSTSLHLDPSGHVRVCELNSLGMVGRIPHDRLIDIWHGRPVARIREALARHDLSRGCEGCREPIVNGRRELAHAAYYDRFSPADPARATWPRQLELSLSNTCNLQCVMCNGDLSSSIRAQREHLPPLEPCYDEQFFADLAQFLPHLERIAFIGGEPFLGAESMRVFSMLMEEGLAPVCAVTTNGTVLTPRVRAVLDALPVEVSVSVDAATPERYAEIRVGGDFHKVMANVDQFCEHARSVSLSYCLMMQNADEFVPFLVLGDRLDLPVHVNVVTAPQRFSLHHLPPDELGSVIEAVRRAGEATRLGRNAWVWERELRRLEVHRSELLDRARADDGRAVFVASPGSARVLAADGADDRGVHAVHIGSSEQILAIEPDAGDVLGMDLRGEVGGHLTALAVRFNEGFGDLVSSDLSIRPDGVEQRTMVYERGGVRTTLRAIQGVGSPDLADATACWYLAARSEAAAGDRGRGA